jgi:hypothetical protein
MDELCELWRSTDIERAFDVRQALVARGVDAQVWGGWGCGRGRSRGGDEIRVMVQRRDLVYARWVAWGVGVDAWPAAAGDLADVTDGAAVRAERGRVTRSGPAR